MPLAWYNRADMITYLRPKIAALMSGRFGQATDLGRFELTYCDPKFGDFSLNAAMVYAKELGVTPRVLAEELAEALRGGLEGTKRVEVAGPGFINLTMTDDFWVSELAKVDRDYGRGGLGKGKKVQVEYISANPTGPTTIGNARGGFIGEVLSRVLDRAGYAVTREYYFNNAGTQITKLLESVKMEVGLMPESQERQYRGDYIKELAGRFGQELASRPDEEVKSLLTTEILKRYIEPAVAKMGIRFDVWFNEADLLADDRFEETLRRLRERNLVFERDGAVWLKTGELGDERPERVLVKSNGDPTYMAPDIAYHVDIFGARGFDYAIKVLGPDHVAQFPSVYAAVHALFPDKEFRMAGYQQMRIMREGREVKVSKRLGQFITVEELIDQVGQPIALFFTLMRSAESHMDFDLDLAVERSAKNPYFYVMYAYARANSVVAKAAEKGWTAAAGIGELNDLERRLVKQMSRLPELVEEMATDYGVHRLTFYGLDLAKLFQEYYESFRLIDLPAKEAASKLYIMQRFIIFMEIYWSLLGIEPQRRMEQG